MRNVKGKAVSDAAQCISSLVGSLTLVKTYFAMASPSMDGVCFQDLW